MKALVFDTETTGLPAHPAAKDSVQPRIIEFGAVLVDREGEVHRQLQRMANPGQALEAKITEITGLTDEDLKDEPGADALLDEMEPMFREADAVIAHNLPFDSFLVDLEVARHRSEPWPWPSVRVCTVQEHFEMWGYRPKLLDLYKYYMGRPLEQTHRALDDVMALVQVCQEAGVLHELHSTITG